MYYPFIPAYAGHTHPLPGGSGGRDFHPRIRGAHPGALRILHDTVLSSPHTRGTHQRSRVPPPVRTFIPAYAGHTANGPGLPQRIAFHPRIRGAHSNSATARWPVALSSPHTRGTPTRGTGRGAGAPFIPAYAGHTRARLRCCHLLPLSSPHTRGTRVGMAFPSCQLSFIPAYAGHTSGPDIPMSAGTLSSPHTRGTRVVRS